MPGAQVGADDVILVEMFRVVACRLGELTTTVAVPIGPLTAMPLTGTSRSGSAAKNRGDSSGLLRPSF